MRKAKFLILICAAAAVLSLALVDRAQDNAGVIKVEVHLVEVYATVFDHKGYYVDGLGRGSFEVYEDGKRQQISSFETQSQGLSCAILLDTSGSMAEALPRVKNSIVKFIDQLDSHDMVAIYTFDQRLVTRQEFTTDKGMAKRAVLRTRAEGGTALFDSLSEVSLETSARSGKKAIVVFTDGDDNSSALTANTTASRAAKLGIPLYAIAAGEATRSKHLRATLNELSQRTGGATYEVKRPTDTEGVFLDVTHDLQHLYMISYHAPAGPADGRWRKIDLAVKGMKKYSIRAKEGYYPD
ncbi:MAG: VWA domain-containing protein [Terriglobia bacterium]|jgi:VWFA-related protein